MSDQPPKQFIPPPIADSRRNETEPTGAADAYAQNPSDARSTRTYIPPGSEPADASQTFITAETAGTYRKEADPTGAADFYAQKAQNPTDTRPTETYIPSEGAATFPPKTFVPPGTAQAYPQLATDPSGVHPNKKIYTYTQPETAETLPEKLKDAIGDMTGQPDTAHTVPEKGKNLMEQIAEQTGRYVTQVKNALVGSGTTVKDETTKVGDTIGEGWHIRTPSPQADESREFDGTTAGRVERPEPMTVAQRPNLTPGQSEQPATTDANQEKLKITGEELVEPKDVISAAKIEP